MNYLSLGGIIAFIIFILLIVVPVCWFIVDNNKWLKANRVYIEEHANKFKVGSKIIYLGIEMEINRNKYFDGICMVNILEAIYVDKNGVIRNVCIKNYDGVKIILDSIKK